MAHDVFISFSFSDQKKAEAIVEKLTDQYHITCWICTKDIGGGQNFKLEIPRAIRESKAVVFLKSAASLRSNDIPKECHIALETGKKVIPFWLDNTDPTGSGVEYDLAGIEYIDVSAMPFDEGVRRLAETISGTIGRPLAVSSDDVSTESCAAESETDRNSTSNIIRQAELHRDLAISYENLGRIAYEQGDLVTAKMYYEKGLAIREQFAKESGSLEARRALAISYNNLGNVAERQGDLFSAKAYYIKGLDTALE